MGKYNEYVWEYLQKYAQDEDKDLTNIVDLTTLSTDHLFDNAPLNVLSDTARSNFITQFTLHYLQDEFGLETIALWKLALAEKLYNNNHKINLIYDNLMRQFYSEYESYNAHGHGTRTTVGTAEDVKQSQRTNAQTKDDSITDSSIKSNTGTQTDAGSTNNNRTLSTTDTENISEIANTVNNVTSNDNKTYNENNTGNASDISNKNGDEHNITTGTHSSTITDDGTTNGSNNNTKKRVFDEGAKYEDDLSYVEDLPNTYDEIEHTAKYSDVTTAETKGGYKDKNSSRNDNNDLHVQYDTPQGSLSNMRTPGGTPGGSTGEDKSKRGVAYATGQTYNYMSAAEENDGTSWQDGENVREYGISGKNDGKYEEITKTDHDINGETSFDKTRTTRKSNSEKTADISRTIGNETDGTATMNDELHGNVQISRNSNHHWTGQDNEEITDSGTTTESKTNTRSDQGTDGSTTTKGSSETGSSTHAETDEKTGIETSAFNSATTDNFSKTNARNHTSGGSVADSGYDNRIRTDNLHENVTATRGAKSDSVGTEQGSETATQNTTQNEINGSTNDYERYKINFLQLTADNDLMQMLWDIFDDLFMMIY